MFVLQPSLRSILLSVMLLVSVVPIVFFSYWAVDRALDREYQAVNEKHLLLAKNLSAALERYSVDVLAVFNAVTEELESGAITVQQIKLLKQLNLHTLGQYKKEAVNPEIIFGDAAFLPERLEFRASLFTQVSSVFSQSLPMPTLYLYREDKYGRVWVAAMANEYVAQLQEAVSFGEKGHAAIVDSTGSVLAHPNKEWQAQAKNIAKISVVKRMLRGETGVERFYSPAMKADMIAGFTVTPTLGWGIMIPQPVSELDAAINDFKKVTLVVAIACFVICFILSWQLSGLLMRPIRKLTKQIQGMTVSHISHLETIEGFTGIKETQALVESFNLMANEVNRGRKELEFRVLERTKELKSAERFARHLASHDSVTDLPNRTAVRQAIAKFLERKQPFSLLFIDLDGFKAVNDEYGHQTGDLLLKAVAQRLLDTVGQEDMAARYAGDEFIVLLKNQSTQEATQIAQALLETIAIPVIVERKALVIGASIGLVTIDVETTSTNVDSLIHEADIAMYQAKSAGKGRVVQVQKANEIN
ncbi:TPA: diguanylate cyclase [Vibrio vulnificus]|nr:diguanylate cyclase [Vibrio vulnificus]